MAVLGRRGGVDVKLLLATPRRHNREQNRVFWRILRRCPRWRLGRRWLLGTKNGGVNNGALREVAHARKRNLLYDLNKISQDGRYFDVITYANFGEDRLKGFGVAGSNFVLVHWLWSSPLQHTRTTVRLWWCMPRKITAFASRVTIWLLQVQ